jgi:hypothetical protein
MIKSLKWVLNTTVLLLYAGKSDFYLLSLEKAVYICVPFVLSIC